MKELLASIDQCLGTQNWYAATALSLTVPDVCAALESLDGRASGKLYASWFDKYLGAKYGSSTGGGEPWLTGCDCYALRCAFLHQASDDISTQAVRRVYERIRIHESEHLLSIQSNLPRELGIPDTLFICAGKFCQDICEAAMEWLADAADREPMRSRLSSTVLIRRGPPQLD